MTYAKTCCVPAYAYFKEKFDNDLRPVVLAFKAALARDKCTNRPEVIQDIPL